MKLEIRKQKIGFWFACFLISVFCFLFVAHPQDPGSMASRVKRPPTCSGGQVLKYNATSAEYECQAEGGGGLPAGVVVLIVSGTCPSGFVEETSLNGKMALGTLAANADIGTTGGSDNVTPAGTVSQPTFTGNALAGHSHTFTGSALAAHGHTYSTVIAHQHTQTVNTGTTGAQVGYGVDTSTSGSQNTGLSTVSTGSASGSTTSDSAGTPAGTVSSDTAGTPGGTVSQPTFTGTSFDNRSAFVRVIFCRKS